MGVLLGILLTITSLFLMLIVLLQRGRGGGLTGALGGLGGSSAFGAKAGDMFTRITIGVATAWILLCVVSLKFMGAGTDVLDVGQGAARPAETSIMPGPAAGDQESDGAAGGGETN